MNLKKKVRSLFAIALFTGMALASVVPQPTLAQETGWQLRMRGTVVDSDQRFSIMDSDGTEVIAGGNAGLGAGIALEYRFTEHLGVELGASFAEVPEFESDRTSSDGRTVIGDGPSFAPLTAALNIHLSPDRRADVYFAPTVAFIEFGDFDLEIDGQTRSYEVDNELAFGGTVGVDVQLGDSAWAINGAVTYLDTDMEITDTATGDVIELSFDPLMFQAGVTFSF